jgi:luciferase-like monooxygenase
MTEGIAAAIAQHVSAWAGVTVERRGYGFVEFRVGRREIGHLHGSRLADLPFPVRIREQLVASGKAVSHYLHPETGWVSFYITGEQDVAAIVDLFRLNYDRPWLEPVREAPPPAGR